jgi:cardiolipin synthase A/B
MGTTKAKTKKGKRSRDEYLQNNRVKLVHGGKEFFQLLKKLIEQAKHSIHFQIYIFDEDKAGNYIANALIKAAKRNVAVYLLVDGYASQKLSKEFRTKLGEAGIQFRFFEPLLRSRRFYFGRRLHHKVIVVDGIDALVGSMNISDRYLDPPEEETWFDLAIYAQGEVAIGLEKICWKFWTKRRIKTIALPEESLNYPKSIPAEERKPVRIRENDWVNRRQQVYRTYMTMFRQAEKSLSVVCSYFIPGQSLLEELKKAVKRGVDVRLVLTGFSDVKVAKAAERYLYRWMWRNKIKVYEYQPAVLHAKFAVMDNEFVTLGSYNVNNISAYASIELNLDVKHKPFAEEVQKEIDELIKRDCKMVDLKTYNSKLFSFKQFARWASFYFIRIVLNLTTFYFRQKE